MGALGKRDGKHGKDRQREARTKGQQGQQDKDRDMNKDSIECWICGKRSHYSKDCWREKHGTIKGGSKGKNKHKNTTDVTKPGNGEPGVEIGGFHTSYFNVDAVEVQERV